MSRNGFTVNMGIIPARADDLSSSWRRWTASIGRTEEVIVIPIEHISTCKGEIIRLAANLQEKAIGVLRNLTARWYQR